MHLCVKFITAQLLLVLLICFAPGIPPNEEFKVVNVPRPQQLKGPLALNGYLNYAEKLHVGLLDKPESIAVKNDEEVYVGLMNGDIVKVFGNNFENTNVVYKAKCGNDNNGRTCGRPLGMRYLSGDKLLVADGYQGIYIVNIKTGKAESVIDAGIVIDQKPSLFLNDLDIDKEGNIYWSHSSTISDLTNPVLDLLVGPSGRFLKYHSKTKKNEVLITDLNFANGVQLSPDQSFVLVAECMGRRVHRYWIKGAKKGKSEIFMDNLPGGPDNIRARPEGGYYVSIIRPMNANTPDLPSIMGKYPIARRFIARIFTFIQQTAVWINNFYPNSYSKSISHYIFHFETFNKMTPFPKGAIVVEADENGKIIGSLQTTTGNIVYISETQRVGNSLLFGSPFANFLGRLDVRVLEEQKKQPTSVPPPKKNEEL